MAENILGNLINNLLQDRNLNGNSIKWANWMSQLTIYTCKYCFEHHGQIVDITVLNNKNDVMAHPNCKCIYVSMRTKSVGTATDMGVNGVDADLFHSKKLPSYYVTKKVAYSAGWKKKTQKIG